MNSDRKNAFSKIAMENLKLTRKKSTPLMEINLITNKSKYNEKKFISEKKFFQSNHNFSANKNNKENSYIRNLKANIKKELFSSKSTKLFKYKSIINDKNINHQGDTGVTDDEGEFISSLVRFKKEFLFIAEKFAYFSEFLPLFELFNFQFVNKIFYSSKYKSNIKKKMTSIFLKGITTKDQRLFWKIQTRMNYINVKFASQYKINANRVSIFTKDITKDLDRTYQCQNHFSSLKDQSKLKRLLIALSNSDPEIGYVQGLNVLVSCFLSNGLNEEEGYWMTKYFMKKMKLRDVLTKNFPRLRLLTYQLESFLRNYLPNILEHLKECDLTIDYFTDPWFITLFASDLPSKTLNKVWNLFLIKGWKIIIKCALALIYIFKGYLKYYKIKNLIDEILKKNSDELGDYLRSFYLHFTQSKENELFEKIINYKVTNRLLQNLESIFKEGIINNLHLISSNKNGKLIWDIDSYLTYFSETAQNAYEKYSIQFKEKAKNHEDIRFWQNIQNKLQELFSNPKSIEEKNSLHEKINKLNKSKKIPFNNKNQIFTQKTNFSHISPLFSKINQIALQSETDLPETESNFQDQNN